jgi:DNA-binding transcriptional regulator YiaG
MKNATHHYTESGLRNIWLANGFEQHKTAYGRGVAFDNIEGMHHEIGRNLCAYRPRLTGPEFRFLRHELDLSQAALAALLGNNEQAVALWKKSKVKVSAWADRLMRALYREHMGENVKIKKLIEAVAELENSKPLPTRFEARETASGWTLKAA